jgi:hypothetical protein
MRKGIAAFLLASLVFFASSQASTVRLATSWDGGAARLSTLKIEPREGGFLVDVLDGTGRVTGSASFDSGFRPTHYAQSGGEGERAYEVSVREGDRLAIRIDGSEKIVACERQYAPDGDSQFWFLSKWIASDPHAGTREIVFLDPEDMRLVEMSVKRLGTERLSIGGRSMDAARFEMSLSSGFLKLFWPYASTYWFSTDDMRFLAYEGRDRRGRTVRVEAVE